MCVCVCVTSVWIVFFFNLSTAVGWIEPHGGWVFPDNSPTPGQTLLRSVSQALVDLLIFPSSNMMVTAAY